MAIAEDASTPAVVPALANTTTTQVTASFTPPAGALLIAMAGNCWNANYVGTPGPITYSDSLGGTWTAINNINNGSGGSVMCGTAYRVIGSSGAAMTVTATSVDALSKDKIFAVRVITGAKVSGTIATSLAAVTGTTANFTQQTVTTTTVGSKPMIVICDDFQNPDVVNANTTEYGNAHDGVVNAFTAAGRATNLTTTPGSLSIGWTGSTAGNPQTVCVIELMPERLGRLNYSASMRKSSIW